MKHDALLRKALVGLFALSLSAEALAIMSVPNGWYIEGNAGSARLTNKDYPGDNSSSGLGGNINLGYKFMPFLGLEIGYSQYPNSTINDGSGTEAAKDKLYSYGIAGRGIVPITDTGFELFAKLGASRMNSRITVSNSVAANSIGIGNSSHSTTGLYWGIGGQYYFLPELAAVVQFQEAMGNNQTGTESLFSAGLSFIFD